MHTHHIRPIWRNLKQNGAGLRKNATGKIPDGTDPQHAEQQPEPEQSSFPVHQTPIRIKFVGIYVPGYATVNIIGRIDAYEPELDFPVRRLCSSALATSAFRGKALDFFKAERA
jgi:hypothetical protein